MSDSESNTTTTDVPETTKEIEEITEIEDITFKTFKYDINIKEVENHKSDGLDQSYIKLKFTGKDFNIKLANTIKRVSMNNIPVYAFPPEQISITVNTSIAFNNDMMKLRLSQLPVTGIDSKLYFLPEKYWYRINYGDNKREKHSNEQNVELYINYHNNTDQIVSVTTNDASVFIDGEKIEPYDKIYPILLIKLKPNNKFQCHMKASLGVAENNAIWTAGRNVFYDEDEKDKSILMTVEGNWQFTEYELLIRTCKYIIHRLNGFKSFLTEQIKQKKILPEKMIFLNLEKEDHTFGELLNYEFQNHNDIIFSGASKPDHLIKAMLIKTICKSTIESPLNAMLESIDVLIKKFNTIGVKISKNLIL